MTIDPSALDGYRQAMGDEADAFIADVIAAYLENSPKLLADIESALQQKDAPTFTRAAHTLKSSSALLGAMAVSKLALELEMLGKSAPLAGAQEKVLQIKQEYEKASAALKAMLA